jgi:hypothetical protein
MNIVSGVERGKMKLPENDYQILKLTDAFYNDYPNPPYTEILEKQRRAYNCFVFQTHYDFFIAVPYRSEISHKYSFRFKTSARSRRHKSGLDYTKIVLLGRTAYLDNKDAIIDREEYKETLKNIEKIKREALTFVEEYMSHMNGVKKLHSKEFTRRYGYSPLKYFHKEMGIDK